ncbi:MAG: ABC transporter ATP-binding protein [Armatimonadetes bacterium]|nr:ABC transporter ATP-binding protein [Armatimonadota bacterium]
MTDSPALSLARISCAFGSLAVLDGVTFDVAAGEFVVLVGPSGCGKTTLLNVLAGSLAPTAGTVEARGARRTVYQQDGLFPWLTVGENIALGLRGVTDVHERERQQAELLALIRLEDFAGHYPHQLSGGMRQRVELARALAGHSDILLMDEPFSALDYQTRLRLRRELVHALAARPRTVVFVTHDIEEAAQLADRVLVLSERPARIQDELRITLPRPRAVTHPRVVEASERILDALGLREETAEALSVPAPEP